MMLAARLMRGRRGRIALVASVALNPSLILMSAWWGQLDSVTMALAMLGIVLMIEERPFWAGLAAGAAAMVKVQGVFFVPLIMIGSLRSRRSLAGAATGLAIGLAIPALPFVISGQGVLVVGRVVALVASPGWLTVNALNVWFLISGGRGNWGFNAPLVWADTSPLVAGVSARVVGMALLAGWMAFTVIGAWRARKGSTWLLAGVLVSLGMFLLPTQAHERYVLGAVGFGALYAAYSSGQDFRNWRGMGLYAMISTLVALNLWWASPPLPSMAGLSGTLPSGMIIAAGFVFVAGWGAWQLWKLSIMGRDDARPD
jgi:Gpi18-like mannosyltransferase